MNRRLLTAALAAIVLPLGLSACGNKGPLVLPDTPVDAPVPVEPSAPPPTADPAPAQDSGTPAR